MSNMDTNFFCICDILIRTMIIISFSGLTCLVTYNSVTIYNEKHDIRSAIVQAILFMSLISIFFVGSWLKTNEARDYATENEKDQEEHICNVTQGSNTEETCKNKQVEMPSQEKMIVIFMK